MKQSVRRTLYAISLALLSALHAQAKLPQEVAPNQIILEQMASGGPLIQNRSFDGHQADSGEESVAVLVERTQAPVAQLGISDMKGPGGPLAVKEEKRLGVRERCEKEYGQERPGIQPLSQWRGGQIALTLVAGIIGALSFAAHPAAGFIIGAVIVRVLADDYYKWPCEK
jgi:hypothetical protein